MSKFPMRALASCTLVLAAHGAQAGLVVDPFETGLFNGSTTTGIPLGFFTFRGPNGSISATTSAPTVPVPGSAVGNQVLNTQFAVSGPAGLGGFAGVARFFSNPTLDTWTNQDWSAYNALRFWMFGRGTGTELFVDIIDNRNPGSSSEDAERFVSSLIDDFTGWRQITLNFASFTRKDIGNGAPNDGLGLTQVHGWAIGSLATPPGIAVNYLFDDISVVSVPEPSSLLLMAAAGAALWRTRRRRPGA